MKMPLRYFKFKVGKYIGGCVYLHKDYEDNFHNIEKYKKHLPESFDYTVVKFNKNTWAYSFILCDNFDTEQEPTLGISIHVSKDGNLKVIKPSKDSWVYHHKWLMVKDDYKGFDVEASKERSLSWINIKEIDYSRIGKKSYWEDKVINLIGA